MSTSNDSAGISNAERSRGHFWYVVALVLLSGSLYVFTLAPTVTSEDSGELITAAWHFGIPHPPGYPLWTMLCGLFIRVMPIEGIAYRANLFSALCTSLATVPLVAALVGCGIARRAAFAATLAWACSRTLWTQAVITEVYGLNALITASLLWVTVRWYGSRNNRWLIAASALLGLGMSNHHTVAFIGLALAVWAVVIDKSLHRKLKLILASASGFACGLLPYAYLPVRAEANPPMNWGDPSTASRLWAHVSRHQYGSVAPLPIHQPRSLQRFARQSAYVAGVGATDLSLPVAMFALGGLALMVVRKPSLALLVLLGLFSVGPLFIWIANIDLDRTSRHAMRVFFIPVATMLTIPLGFGLHCLLAWGRASPRRGKHVVAAIVVLILPFLPAVSNFRRCDYSNYWYALDHARNLLHGMLPNGMVFPSGDHNTFPLIYLTQVEGVRSDVVIADKYGYVDPAVVAAVASDRGKAIPQGNDVQLRSWLIRAASRPVYFTTLTGPPVDGATMVPVGLSYHLLPVGRSLDRDSCWQEITYRNLDEPGAADLGRSCILADYYFFRALNRLRLSQQDPALADFAAAARHAAGLKEGLNNIGSALADHGLIHHAVAYFEDARELDALYTTPRRNLARILERLNRRAELKQVLGELVALEPAEKRWRQQLDQLKPSQPVEESSGRPPWRP